jgi:hypothetical protein
MNKEELIKWASDTIQKWSERNNNITTEPDPINVRLAWAILKLAEVEGEFDNETKE